jgi:SAM-dependent methyltransferase
MSSSEGAIPNEASGGHQGSDATSRVGFRAALALGTFGVCYAVVAAVGMSRAGPREPIVDPVLAVMEMLTLLSAPLVVILLVAIHGYAPAERKTMSLIALSFGILMAGLTSTVHFVELTAGRQTGAVTLAWPSVAYAAELLAWDVFLGLALVFAGWAFGGGGWQARARWALWVTGWLCLLGTLGPAAGDMRLQRLGILGYGIGLPVTCFILAVGFRSTAARPRGGRRPTSHERMTGLPWDASYHDGPAPWDIGRPQPRVVRLASEGGFAGAVLDAGCGTGENALHVASLGLSVLGVDVAETALAIAREKADDRGIEVEFAAADAFQLERLGRMFGTVLDCGLFHTFDRDERPAYAASLASVTEHGGTLYVLCFSDDGPDRGPHPISQEKLRAAFNPRNGWNVVAIEPDRLQSRYHDDGAPAWFATIKRI